MWITYSALMFFSSVLLYLAVRKANLLQVPNPLINLAMFAVPLPFYTLLAWSAQASFSLRPFELILLIVTGILCAFLGNVASLKALSLAPNPGYSLILSKSYVLFTTVFAFAFLGASLTHQKVLAILMIVAFAAVILFEHAKDNPRTNRMWIPLSVYAFFAWGFLSLSSKYLFRQGVTTEAFLVLLYVIVTLCILATGRSWPQRLKDRSSRELALLLLAGIFSTLFNLGQFLAIRSAPNVGYVNAINAASIGLVALAAAVVYHDELNTRKLTGILGIIVGLFLLLL